MRFITILFIFIASIATAAGQSVQEKRLQNFNKVRLASVYDGDTFKVYLACHYPVFCRAIPVRVRGINTPEIKGGTEQTKAAAQAAKKFTKEFLKSGKILLRNCWRDKYFRLLCDVKVNGKDLAEELLSSGHATPYVFKSQQKQEEKEQI